MTGQTFEERQAALDLAEREGRISYEIVFRDAGGERVVATAATRKGARRAVDRRDNAYGAYRHFVRQVGEV